MIVIIGLVILIAAVLVGVAGVFANGGSTHTLTDDFAVFGYHVTGQGADNRPGAGRPSQQMQKPKRYPGASQCSSSSP